MLKLYFDVPAPKPKVIDNVSPRVMDEPLLEPGDDMVYFIPNPQDLHVIKLMIDTFKEDPQDIFYTTLLKGHYSLLKFSYLSNALIPNHLDVNLELLSTDYYPIRNVLYARGIPFEYHFKDRGLSAHQLIMTQLGKDFPAYFTSLLVEYDFNCLSREFTDLVQHSMIPEVPALHGVHDKQRGASCFMMYALPISYLEILSLTKSFWGGITHWFRFNNVPVDSMSHVLDLLESLYYDARDTL